MATTNSTAPNARSSSRRWLRFRLRTLLILTAVLAVVLTFAGREVREWRRRERARAQRAQLLGLGDYPGDIPIPIRRIPQNDDILR